MLVSCPVVLPMLPMMPSVLQWRSWKINDADAVGRFVVLPVTKYIFDVSMLPKIILILMHHCGVGGGTVMIDL